MRFSGGATVDMQAPPTLGQHTEPVLRQVLELQEHEVAVLPQQDLV